MELFKNSIAAVAISVLSAAPLAVSGAVSGVALSASGAFAQAEQVSDNATLFQAGRGNFLGQFTDAIFNLAPAKSPDRTVVFLYPDTGPDTGPSTGPGIGKKSANTPTQGASGQGASGTPGYGSSIFAVDIPRLSPSIAANPSSPDPAFLSFARNDPPQLATGQFETPNGDTGLGNPTLSDGDIAEASFDF